MEFKIMSSLAAFTESLRHFSTPNASFTLTRPSDPNDWETATWSSAASSNSNSPDAEWAIDQAHLPNYLLMASRAEIPNKTFSLLCVALDGGMGEYHACPEDLPKGSHRYKACLTPETLESLRREKWFVVAIPLNPQTREKWSDEEEDVRKVDWEKLKREKEREEWKEEKITKEGWKVKMENRLTMRLTL